MRAHYYTSSIKSPKKNNNIIKCFFFSCLLPNFDAHNATGREWVCRGTHRRSELVLSWFGGSVRLPRAHYYHHSNGRLWLQSLKLNSTINNENNYAIIIIINNMIVFGLETWKRKKTENNTNSVPTRGRALRWEKNRIRRSVRERQREQKKKNQTLPPPVDDEDDSQLAKD